MHLGIHTRRAHCSSVAGHYTQRALAAETVPTRDRADAEESPDTTV
jgi:hypothetical protein